MKKNTLYFLFILIAIVVVAKSSLAAKSAGKITCQEFIRMDDISRPKIVYWLDGFDRKGNVEDANIDFTGNDRLVPILVEECTQNPTHILMNKLKTAHKKLATP